MPEQWIFFAPEYTHVSIVGSGDKDAPVYIHLPQQGAQFSGEWQNAQENRTLMSVQDAGIIIDWSGGQSRWIIMQRKHPTGIIFFLNHDPIAGRWKNT